MILEWSLAAGAAAAAAGLIAWRIVARRGQMVFLAPSGRKLPEFYDPLAWRALVK